MGTFRAGPCAVLAVKGIMRTFALVMNWRYYAWTALERFGANGISLVGNLCLAYFVSQADFGVVGAVSVFLALTYITIDCGMGDGIMLVPHADDRAWSTLFWFNAATGLALGAIFWGISSPMAAWFGLPQVRGVLRLMAVGVFLGALQMSFMVRLRYETRFGTAARVSLIATAGGIAGAIAMGACGMGYWAVASTNVLYNLSMVLCIVAMGRFRVQWTFDRQLFLRLWRYGRNLLASGIIYNVSRNIYTFVLGKWYNPSVTGYFYQAQRMQDAPMCSLEGAISTPTLVVVSKASELRERALGALKGLTHLVWLYCVLVGAGQALARPLIDTLLPERWLPVVPYFRVLLVLGFFQGLNRHIGVTFKVFGRTDTLRNISICEYLLIIVAVLAMVHVGILEMVWVAIVLTGAMTLVYLWYDARLTGLRLRQLVGTTVKPVLVMAIPSIAAYAMAKVPMAAWAQLLAGLVVYLAITADCLSYAAPQIWARITRLLHLTHQ